MFTVEFSKPTRPFFICEIECLFVNCVVYSLFRSFEIVVVVLDSFRASTKTFLHQMKAFELGLGVSVDHKLD